MRGPKGFLGMNTARKIRAMREANHHITPDGIIKLLHLTITRAHCQRVLDNKIWRDPAYRVIYLNHKRAKVYEKMATRKPSIECAFTCRICGMGYSRRREANACCVNAVVNDNGTSRLVG